MDDLEGTPHLWKPSINPKREYTCQRQGIQAVEPMCPRTKRRLSELQRYVWSNEARLGTGAASKKKPQINQGFGVNHLVN